MSSPIQKGRPRVWRESDGVGALPQTWGAYRFLQPEGMVAYLGITSNLYNRISWHRSVRIHYDPAIHSVQYQIAQPGAHWDELCEWEKSKIAQHSPELITYIGGNGKKPAIEINGGLVEIPENQSVEDVLIEKGLFERLGAMLRFW